MLNKHRSIIFAALAIILAIAILLCVSYFSPVRVLPRGVKAEIKHDLEENTPTGHTFGVAWYDECGSWESMGVHKYLGKYGDCYAFLVRTAGYTVEYREEYLVPGLPSEVWFPARYIMEVVLYHTQRDYTMEEIYGKERYGFMYFDGDKQSRCAQLTYMVNREEWISDYELERLTSDVAKIAESFQ